MKVLMRCNELYELWTGLYMLDPWEKLLFSELMYAVDAPVCCTKSLLPFHLSAAPLQIALWPLQPASPRIMRGD